MCGSCGGYDEVVAVVGGVGDGQWVGEVAIVGNVVFLVSSFLPAVLVLYLVGWL